MAISLGELATRFGCELIGDGEATVDNVASLPNAGPRSLSFLSNPAYREYLATTQAGAVILRADDADAATTAVFVSEDPYLTYARMAAAICPPPAIVPGIHTSAQVAATAAVADSAQIGPHVVIGERATIGPHCFIGPGSVIGDDCTVGAHGRLIANVTIVRKVTMGERCIVHPGAVIGADGFGNARSAEGWVKVPQLGGVRIGNDVEIGANSTIDCGAFDDTVIEDGVRLDNLVMIAHNVHVGAHTAMAAMTGIAGSAVIGKRCLFAGQSGSVGHVTICDDVIVSGQAMVTKNITEPGVYAAAFAAAPLRDWNRGVARIRRLDSLQKRVRELEKQLK